MMATPDPCEPPGQNDRDEAEAEGNPIKRRQIMLEMDMQMWKDAIEMCMFGGLPIDKPCVAYLKYAQTTLRNLSYLTARLRHVRIM